MTENRFSVECDDADIWEENHFLAVAYNHNNALKLAERLNELANENKKLKKVIQAIITKEFELSSDDNDYDPLSEFFNNEVSISQIEVEIDVEKND